MTDQDTLYYELRDALKAGGCSLCSVSRRAATRTIDTLNYEGVNDPGLRHALQASHGLCHRHAWEWTHMRGSPLGVAIVYQNLVKDMKGALEKSISAGTRSAGTRSAGSRRQAARGLMATGLCPACEAENAAAERYGSTLLAHLELPEIVQSYREAGGLCLPHLHTVLGRANEAQARTLQSWQLEIYQGLHAELSEFIRKHDHRFGHEPFGAEKDSWLRAVASFVGESNPES